MRKILAIDDKQDNLITISAFIKTYITDCIVITALSGIEGIKIAERELPDTICWILKCQKWMDMKFVQSLKKI